MKEVIFKLVELVEQAISKEMKTAECGAILHDGWTCGGVHYIGLYASYMRQTGSASSISRGLQEEVVELSLLSCSPMAKPEVDDPEKDDGKNVIDSHVEAVTFSAFTHVEHIKSMFRFYDLDVCEWDVCQIADNCYVNRSVARLLQVPHVGCKSHLLNLEVNHMVKQTGDLDRTLDSVHNTMSHCKQRLKDAALLRNLVELKPIVHNKTRWSGKFMMLQRFLRIRGELIQVSQDDGSDLVVNATNAFKTKVLKYTRHMKQIDLSTKYLQYRKLSLGQCRESLNMLMEDVEMGCNDDSSDLYGCTLGRKYISAEASILPDPAFESGVCKIQAHQEQNMSPDEHTACLRLLRDATGSTAIAAPTRDDMSYEERLRSRKRRKANDGIYRRCDFILGSAAEVERLWSIAGHILTHERMSTTPLLFEAIIFLRVNARLWDSTSVKTAFHMSKSGRVIESLDQDESQFTEE